jgi:malto-oligosyltrehalose trehalohydrolase
VFLDVVYNHLGPEGNYLGECGPYLSPHHSTVWGSAPNFDHPQDGAQLRRFFIANAIHWLDEYHFDGLRLDAIHCMRDESEPHVAAELSSAVRRWSSASGRSAMLIAESNVYDPNMLTPVSMGGIGFDAEWCDDFLHSVFAIARPDEQLSHRHYVAGVDLDQTLRFGYVYEGTLRTERGRQRPDKRVDTSGLVYAIQHHDSIGNHPLGKRLHQVASPEFQQAASALLLLSPAIPMLFMGEEFACRHPFQFFVDFGDDALRQSVVEGRRREYPQHDWSGGTLPIDASAFLESKIGSVRDGSPSMRSWYRQLLQLRRRWRDRGLLDDVNLSVATDPNRGCYCLQYQADEASLLVAVRLNAIDSLDQEQGNMRASHGLLVEPIALPVIGELVLDSRQDESTARGELLTNELLTNELLTNELLTNELLTNELLTNHAKVFVRDPFLTR